MRNINIHRRVYFGQLRSGSGHWIYRHFWLSFSAAKADVVETGHALIDQGFDITDWQVRSILADPKERHAVVQYMNNKHALTILDADSNSTVSVAVFASAGFRSRRSLGIES